MSDPADSGITINLGGGEHESPTLDLNGLKIVIPGPWQVKLVVGIIILVVALYSFIWITEDAQKRGKSGCLAFLFLFAASWPVSILWWLWLRPPLLRPSNLPPPPPPPLPPQDS
jgi:hypothetical protein